MAEPQKSGQMEFNIRVDVMFKHNKTTFKHCTIFVRYLPEVKMLQ